MDKKAFFSAENSATDVQNLNKLMVYTFNALFKVFTIASIVMLAVTPLVNFFDPVIAVFRDIACFSSFITFLILLIGRKNLNRWHFITLLIFAVSFGVFTCLLLGPIVLVFTTPAVIAFGIISLFNRLCSRPVSYQCCWIILFLMIPIAFISVYYLSESIFWSTAAAIQSLLFASLVMIFLKIVPSQEKTQTEVPADWKAVARSFTISLVICHAVLANLSMIAGAVVWIFG